MKYAKTMTWSLMSLCACSAFAGALTERIRECGFEIRGTDAWCGGERTVFTFEGREAWVVEPPAGVKVAEGNPWTWTMQWKEAFPDRTGVPGVLKRGFRHVALEAFDLRMSEEGLRLGARFQRFLVDKLGLAPKARLIGMSWGGFFSTRYAAAYPQSVDRIYLDAPLLNFDQFAPDPTKTPTADASLIGPWASYRPANGWAADPEMPVNKAAAIAKAKIPVLLLYGAEDAIVQPERNALLFASRFRAAGGRIGVISRCQGHHPHGVNANDRTVVDFLTDGKLPGDCDELWPEGKIPNCQPHQHSATKDESEVSGFAPAQRAMPRLEWFEPPANPCGACVILMSGGSYEMRCDGMWLGVAARELAKLGIQCVELAYRTPQPKGLPNYQSAWEDGQRAVRLVRAAAERRGYKADKIGAFAYSAGAHLAVLLATSSQTPAYAPVDGLDRKVPCHLDWAVPMYPGYVLTDGFDGPNTRQGQTIDVAMTDAFKFDAKTCPMCLSHGSVDFVSPNGSTRIYRQLRRMGVPAELHLYADRSHGFMGSMEKPVERSAGYDRWFDRIAEFLRQMSIVGAPAPEENIYDRFKSDGDILSVVREDVWPAGKEPQPAAGQCKPYLEWYVPKTLKTKAIQIVYSGGAYDNNSTDSFEVQPARRYLNAKGMTVVTLKYRTPRPAAPLAKHTSAWQDLQRAVRLVRAGAAKRGLDGWRIGIWGSSAGGHLTLMGATTSRTQSYAPIDDIDKLPCKVQWGVAVYPAYALTDGMDGLNASRGADDSVRLVPEFAFDPDTCPMVFLHGDADGVASMNSVRCWEQLRRMGIGCDLHTFALRDHCFMAKASPGTGSYNYLDMAWQFLNAKGFNR